jgi:outer membrane protein assembly factor BamB
MRRWAAIVAAVIVLGGCASPNWLTYHRDTARTGNDPAEPKLLPVTHAWTTTLDAAVYAQPVVVSGRVIAATERNTVYALDGHDGHVLWSRHLGTPMTNVSAQSGCGDIDPLGITSTPVIDAKTGTVFVVATIETANTVIHHQLVGLDVTNGAVRVSANADPGGVQNPLDIQQRAGLALGNGRVYIGFGGYAGDCGTYHGWLVSLTEAGTAKVAFDATPHTGQGAIWAPSGPAIGAGGNVYVATGNPDPDVASGDYGESVVKLDPTLHVLAHFSGSNATDDEDLGSVGPALLSANMVFQIGKQNVGYLLSQSNLSKFSSLTICAEEAFGGIAYDGTHVFVPCSEHIQEVTVNNTTHTMTLGWHGPATERAGPPILAGGALWSVDPPTAKLYVLNPATGATITTIALGSAPNFASPSSALGLVLVGTGSGVTAFDGPSGPPPHAT